MWSTFLFCLCAWLPVFSFLVLSSCNPHPPLPFTLLIPSQYSSPPPPSHPQKNCTATTCALISTFSIPSTTQVVHLSGLLSYESEPCTQPSLSTCHVDLFLKSDAVSQIDMEVNTNCCYVTVGRQPSFSVTGPTRPVVKQPVWSAEGHNLITVIITPAAQFTVVTN